MKILFTYEFKSSKSFGLYRTLLCDFSTKYLSEIGSGLWLRFEVVVDVSGWDKWKVSTCLRRQPYEFIRTAEKSLSSSVIPKPSLDPET
jgi:hypothetical protein